VGVVCENSKLRFVAGESIILPNVYFCRCRPELYLVWRWVNYTVLCGNFKYLGHAVLSAVYTLKLSDFSEWHHTWRKNWVNCAVLTGSSAVLRAVLAIRLSHREQRISIRESHSFLSLPTDTTIAPSLGTHPSKMNKREATIAWYIPFQIPLLTPHFTTFLLLLG